MELVVILILTMAVFPANAGSATPQPAKCPTIVFFQEGLSCSKIHTEEVRLEERVNGSLADDAAGNIYTMEYDREGEQRYSHQIIKNKGMDSESLFAMLKVPDGYWGSFEAIGFDHSWNMMVAVTWGTASSFAVTRDYYRIGGMPKPQFARRLAFLGVAALLIGVLILSFGRFAKSLLQRNRGIA